MGCGYAPHGGSCPHTGIPLHFQTFLFFMVGTVVYLLAQVYESTIIAHYDRQV